jgi:hypothetical protein
VNRPYSEATVELVARAEFEADQTPEHLITWERALSFVRKAYLDRARVGLDKLAAAGLLLPEGVETRTEWGIRNGFGVHDYRSREQAEMWLDISGSTAGELVRRTVSASPWEPSGDDVRPDEASRT